MTEYDFSPEAYDRYIQTQNRVANWVQHTEQHRQVFEAAVLGAPGLPQAVRRPSPPLPDRYASPHRPSPAYPKPPIYRAPPSSSSDDSYVHVPAPQMRRSRPPPPPIYAPPPPPIFTMQPFPSPVTPIGADSPHRSSTSSRRRHHSSQSHSHSRSNRPPPLVTPIYTSPPASPFHTTGYVYMSPRGYPPPSGARPIISQHDRPPRKQSTSPPGPRTRKPFNYPERSATPPSGPPTPSSSLASPVHYTSAPDSSTSLPSPPSPVTPAGTFNSGLGGSHSQLPLAPRQEDQKHGPYHQHRVHPSTAIISGGETPYNNRGFQQHNHTRRYDNQHHPYHGETGKTGSQSHNSFTALRPQPRRDLYERSGVAGWREPSQPKATATGVISVSVPAPHHPTDDRELAYEKPTLSPRTNKVPVLHAPQPTRHASVLSARIRTSAHA